MTSHRYIIIFLFIFHQFNRAAAGCPNGCICANTVVICTCPSTDTSTTLGSFRNIDFVSEIYIHNCRNLTIPAETFSGLAIGQELSISSIRHLHIHPFAFRDLIKYPTKFTISDSEIPLIPENAFVGFYRVTHMWFRKVNITKIAGGAFRHVSDIEYVYFRESIVNRVESHAFSNMTNISHLFFRGRTKIDKIESSVFDYSIFRKIVFEDVRIRSLNAFSMNGPLRYDSALFENVIVENVEASNGNSKIEKVTSARKLEFVRCRFERRFPLSTICSNVLEVKFNDTHIDRLTQMAGFALRNLTHLRFFRSTINSVEPRAFYGSAGVRDIIFDGSHVKSVGEKSFGSISVDDLNFFKSILGSVSNQAFEGSAIKRLEISECRLESIDPKAFSNSQIGQVRFSYSEIKLIQPEAFGQLRTDYFGLEYTRLIRVREFAFSAINAKSLNISGCDFRPRVNVSWLSGGSFRILSLNTNKFPCSCTSKLTAQLTDLKKRRELMVSSYLSISNNFCIDEASNQTLMLEDYFPTFCRRMDSAGDLLENLELAPGVECVRNLFLVVCTCNGDGYDQNLVFDERMTRKISILRNATALMISQCRRIRMVRNSILHFSLSHLIVNRCENVELETDFWWRKSTSAVLLVRISHVARLRLHRNAFSFSQPSAIPNKPEIEFINCTIDKIVSDVFENARIGRLSFIGSRIGIFEPLVARKSRIDEFSIFGCDVGRLSSWAFNDSIIEKFRLETSRVYELQTQFISEKLAKRAFVCFAENRLACQCDLSGMDVLVNTNGCDGGSNLCFDDQGAPDGRSIEKLGGGDELLAAYNSDLGEYRCYNSVLGAGASNDLPQRDMPELAHSASKTICHIREISFFDIFIMFAVNFVIFCAFI